MHPFIEKTFVMLNELQINMQYPTYNPIHFNGKYEIHEINDIMDFYTGSISIEKIPQMKFLMFFTLIDFYIDINYQLEGKSFAQKYRKLPKNNDEQLILSQLYRIAKLIRNTLVHNPSSFLLEDEKLNINYQYKKTNFSINLSSKILSYFYTALIMYIKGDLGKGPYFLGIIRDIYKKIISGISNFKDDSKYDLKSAKKDFTIYSGHRNLYINPSYQERNNVIYFLQPKPEKIKNIHGDIYFILRNKEYLIPLEVISNQLTLRSDELQSWLRVGTYPAIPNYLSS